MGVAPRPEASLSGIIPALRAFASSREHSKFGSRKGPKGDAASPPVIRPPATHLRSAEPRPSLPPMTKDDTLALWILAGLVLGAAGGAVLWSEMGLTPLGIAIGAAIGLVAGVVIHTIRNQG